jgi:uncharacterized cupin superfamily protein
MNDVIVKKVEEIEAYSGPHRIPGIRFRAAGAALGISAWGMNVFEMDPHCTGYPEHHHGNDGHEELYVVLDGSIELRCGEQSLTLSKGDFVRVAPETPRKFVTHESGATILALGGTPGKAYAASMGVRVRS